MELPTLLLPEWLPGGVTTSWGCDTLPGKCRPKGSLKNKGNHAKEKPKPRNSPWNITSLGTPAPPRLQTTPTALLPLGPTRGVLPRQGAKRRFLEQEASSQPTKLSPKIPGSLLGWGRSLPFLGCCLLLGGLAARGTRAGLELALKKVTMKGCLERGARRPSSPAEPGSTLCPAGVGAGGGLLSESAPLVKAKSKETRRECAAESCECSSLSWAGPRLLLSSCCPGQVADGQPTGLILTIVLAWWWEGEMLGLELAESTTPSSSPFSAPPPSLSPFSAPPASPSPPS